MSRDFGELEREFIRELKARTGRSLEEWMTAIAAAAPGDKNAIIDWLRPQGFTFANASWLERIHHNGGKPIYSDRQTTTPGVRTPATVVAANENKALETRIPDAEAAPTEPPVHQAPTTTSLPSAPRAATPPPGELLQMDALLAAGKAYRPLAVLVMDTIRKAVPDALIAVREGLLTFENPQLFAVLSIVGKGLKLGLCDCGDAGVPGMQTGRITGAPADISKVVLLTDARQVDGQLIEAIAAANRRVNPEA